MTPRFSPSRLALSYIALGVLALALFAIPLWYGYRANLGTFRAYVPGAEMQRLVEIFHRDGPQAVAAAVDSYLPSMPRDEVLIFVDPEKRRLAGSLPAWPAEVPDVPGTYGLVIGLGGDASMRVVTTHVTLPGGYQLLMGRESVRFDSLVARFWYGIAGAVAIVLALGLVFAWLLRRERGQLEALVAQRTAALRLSEERYARAMEATEAGHWEWDLVANEVFHSARFRELYGIALEEKFASRDEWKARQPVSPGERERQERALLAAIADPAKSYDIELFFEPRPGEVRWLRSRGKVFRGEDGRPLRIAGATTDITAQKCAQEALRRSEERYARVMQASEDGFWEWVVASDEFYASPRMLALYGLPPDTVFRGRKDFLSRFPFHPEDLDSWHRAVAAHLAGKTARIDIEVRAKLQRETRWIHLTAVCLRDASGAEERWTGSVSDVTERRRAQEALRRSEERYARAMEGSDAGHWDWNIVTDEMFVSERAREMLALPQGPLPASRADIMALVPQPPDDRLAMHEHVRAGIGRGDFERDYRVIPRAGEVRWLHSRAKVYKDARGAAVRMTGSLTDITERKLAEALLAGEKRILELIARRGTLDAVLDAICRLFDELWPALRSSVTLLGGRGERLRLIAAPRLPPPFVERMAELPVAGPDSGLCGLAVSRGEPVIAQDLIADPAWERFRDLYLAHGLRACWSVPFMSEARKPLGTFAVFSSEPRGPSARELGAIERFGHLAAIAVERKRTEEELKRSEERYSLAMQASEEGHFDWNVRTDEIFVSAHIKKVFGFPLDAEFRARNDLIARVAYHPDDRPWLQEMTRTTLAGPALAHEFEYRILREGAVRWLRTRWKIFRGSAGEAERVVGVVTDITDRKRAADELRESEQRFRALTELSSDWYWRQDENLRFTYVSQQVEDAQYPREWVIGRARWELPGVTPLSMSWDEHKAVVAARQPFREFEYARTGRDGRTMYVSISGAPIFDDQGRFKGYQGTGRNITERRRMEDELRQSEARFRALSELSSDWYWQQDENLRFTYLSGQVQGLTGYSGESSLGKLRWEIASMTPLSCSWAEHQAVLAARQPFRDLECRRDGPDGTVRYLSISGAPIFDDQGNFRGYRGIGRNITERKRVEEALRQSEERYALAVTGSNEGIFDWDLVSDRVYVSHRAQELFGLPRGELWRPRRDWRHILAFDPDDAPRLHDSIKAHIEGGAPTYDEEFRIVVPGGGVRWFRQRGIALRDASGKAYRMVGSIGDVTLRRQAEEELKAMERKLRQAQRLEAMGTLAGGIAHDFNNILGAILGYGEMALRDAPKASRLRRDLDSILTAGERGRALVDRVLAFSRSGVGERVAVNVESVVREALDLASAKLPENVTLHAKLHAGPAAMLGDATQVHQVLMNLATNAVQAMPAGGTLRVSLETMRVDAVRATTIGSLEPGEYLVLKVADTGTGIAPEILDRIFDPFFTTKDVGTGTGLGLSLVHGIVSEVGGAIDVASRVGAGSTFTVYLPRSGDAAEFSSDVELVMPRGDGQRVLVVDDEEPLVRLATRTLEELGYAPVGFTSSAAALAAFRADPQRFDAVITDERMPGISGSALIREVRGIRNGIPIVLMSGYVGDAVASQARAAGAEEVLKKPLSARDLAASLARVLHS